MESEPIAPVLMIKYNDEHSLVEIRPTTDDGYVTRYILMPCMP